MDEVTIYDKLIEIEKKINQCMKLIEGMLKGESPYPALVRAIANLNEDEKTVIAYMLGNGKDTFLLSVHHKRWVKEAIFSLTRKNIFGTRLSVDGLNQFSSGSFYMVGAAFNFLYSNKEVFEDFYGRVKSEVDLYKEEECNNLLCKANTWAAEQGLPEITAAQMLGDEPLPENVGE